MTTHVASWGRFRRLIVAAGCLCALITSGGAVMPSEQEAPSSVRVLVHVTHGPESATRAALAFLVARTAVEEGHAVSLFLAGDAVHLLRDAVLDSITGVGTGSLREHYEAIVKGGGRFYLSGMSSKARQLTAADLEGKPAELAPPSTLVRLAVGHDRMFTY